MYHNDGSFMIMLYGVNGVSGKNKRFNADAIQPTFALVHIMHLSMSPNVCSTFSETLRNLPNMLNGPLPYTNMLDSP